MSVAAEYRDLLARYTPQPIRTDAMYRRMLAVVDHLLGQPPRTAQSRLIEMLATLIENYESQVFPTPQVAPDEMLAFLIRERGVTNATVAHETGVSATTLTNVLARRRGISTSNAQKLGRYFGVSPLLFLPEPVDVTPLSRQHKTGNVTKAYTARK